MNTVTPNEGPETAERLLNEIRLKRVELPRRLRGIADALLEADDAMSLLTAAELSARLEVPPSALIRFAKALGYPGFAPMQKILRGRLLGDETSYRERARALAPPNGGRDDIGYVFEAFASANRGAIDAARQRIDLKALARIVQALKAARTVGVAGQKRAFPLAAYLFYGLARLDVPCLLVDGLGGMADRQAAVLGESDVLVVVTFAPYAPEMIELAGSLAGRGVRVVAITDAPDSPVAAHAEECVFVTEANLNDIRSIAVTSTVIQTLFVSLGMEFDA